VWGYRPAAQEGPRSTISFGGYPPRCRLWDRGLNSNTGARRSPLITRAQQADGRSIDEVGMDRCSMCSRVRARVRASVIVGGWRPVGTREPARNRGGTPVTATARRWARGLTATLARDPNPLKHESSKTNGYSMNWVAEMGRLSESLVLVGARVRASVRWAARPPGQQDPRTNGLAGGPPPAARNARSQSSTLARVARQASYAPAHAGLKMGAGHL
jgi:hypothetical protein